MNSDEYNEKDVSDTESILEFVKTLNQEKTELILSSNGKQVGAILTSEQYDWFLDQLDAQQNIEAINDRASDMDGAQNLSEFKKEFGK
jgi:hypothetical protein